MKESEWEWRQARKGEKVDERGARKKSENRRV